MREERGREWPRAEAVCRPRRDRAALVRACRSFAVSPADNDQPRAFARLEAQSVERDCEDVDAKRAVEELLFLEHDIAVATEAILGDGKAGAFDRETPALDERSEEHTSEIQPLMRNSYAVFF